jgi:hypothetical protein
MEVTKDKDGKACRLTLEVLENHPCRVSAWCLTIHQHQRHEMN